MPGSGPKLTYYYIAMLHWVLLAVCRADGAATLTACVLVKLHAHESCTALLLLLLYVYMLHFYGLPLVVGLRLSLFAAVVNTCINMLLMSSQRSRGPI